MSRLRRSRRIAGPSLGRAVADEADDVVEGRVVAQLERVVACDPVGLADLGEQLGLLDRVDAEVGLQVEVQVEQFGRVAGLLGDQRHHPRRQVLTRRLGRRHRSRVDRAVGSRPVPARGAVACGRGRSR